MIPKLTMAEWHELACCAEASAVARRLGSRDGSHHLHKSWQTDGETGRLTKLGLIRWPSANRATVTRKGLAALKTRSRKFLDYADRLAWRAYQREQAAS